MIVKRLDIGSTLHFESTKFVSDGVVTWSDGCFEFTEHSPDPWYSDRETSISIDAEMALKIISALNDHFNFNAEITGLSG